MTANSAAARRYLAAIEAGATGVDLAAFFDPAVVQEEFPNRLAPNGARRGLAALLADAVRGQQVLMSQHYEVLHVVEDGDHVALEVQWTGKLKIPIATTPAGGEMRARFALFLEFRD